MSIEKSNLHPRNLHRNPYDFEALIAVVPQLKTYVFVNDYGVQTINFSLPKAVKLLNEALLLKYYSVKDWDIPSENLCPPIPGRADYVHYLADLLADANGIVPTGHSVKGLDIGVGANLVYPLVAHRSYGWEMLGSDVNEASLGNARKILDNNPDISAFVKLKLQPNTDSIFKNIINKEDQLIFSMCNPPFHDSQEAAIKGNLRKNKNLNINKAQKAHFNFGGQQSELWCEGGELAFISKMIQESILFSKQVLWFTCLVSKKENLSKLLQKLKNIKALDIKTIDMAQGQKISRILAWSFVPGLERELWLRKK